MRVAPLWPSIRRNFTARFQSISIFIDEHSWMAINPEIRLNCAWRTTQISWNRYIWRNYAAPVQIKFINPSYRVDTTKSRDAVEYRSIFRQRNFWIIYLWYAYALVKRSTGEVYNCRGYRCHRPSCWRSYSGGSFYGFVVAVSKSTVYYSTCSYPEPNIEGPSTDWFLWYQSLAVFFSEIKKVPGRAMCYNLLIWCAIPRDAI